MNCYQVFVLLVIVTTANKSFAKFYCGPGDQECDYVNVRKGAHMFYWLYKTTADVYDYTERPLVIWLQGGPGLSSTGIGNFQELGPFDMNGNYRQSTWVQHVNVLFIDSPVGSGFSFVENEKYLATNNSQIALDLVECMKGFFARHKEFREVPLHIFTKSYGGKMAPEFALELYNANQRREIKCNLISLAIGSSFTSPIDTLLAYAPFLMHTGIIDGDGYDDIMASANYAKDYVDNKLWDKALTQMHATYGIIAERSHNVDFFNILKRVQRTDNQLNLDIQTPELTHFMRGDVSEALGIPRYVKWGSQYNETSYHLSDDMMKPVLHIVSDILNKTDLKVGVYSGQLDLICNTAGTLSWIEKLEWNKKNEYLEAKRDPIFVNNILEGYEKSGGNFTMFWVNRAGHFLPLENPAAMSYILKKFTNFG